MSFTIIDNCSVADESRYYEKFLNNKKLIHYNINHKCNLVSAVYFNEANVQY